MSDASDLLKQLPKVDDLIKRGAAGVPHSVTAACAREVVDRLRADILAGRLDQGMPTVEEVAAVVNADAAARERPNQCRVINATGVVLHTNLGRAVLPESVVEAVAERLHGYSLLEVDRVTGKRSKRDYLVTELVSEMTGAEDAAVVNNNAAATHIILNTLAEGKEVICSHAHLVGIGGSYRLPDCMRAAGVTLRTVGATNHCLVSDYESGINENSGMIILVHTSNYQIVGFTKYASLEELIELGRRHGLPVVYDLGSGALVDVSDFGYAGHSVRELVAAGPDLVCFSGDKLLGGPQAGIIVGAKDTIAAIRKNPFYRMMRLDKMTLALLEATLRLYRDPETVAETVPVLRMISRTVDELRPRAHALADRLAGAGWPIEVEAFEGYSEIGGGSLSNQRMPTACVGVRPTGLHVDKLAERLRLNEPCVFGRIADNRLVFDVRTLLDGEEAELFSAIGAALGAPENAGGAAVTPSA